RSIAPLAPAHVGIEVDPTVRRDCVPEQAAIVGRQRMGPSVPVWSVQLEPAPMVIDVSLGPARDQCDPSIVHVGSSQDAKIRSVRQEALTAICANAMWRADHRQYLKIDTVTAVAHSVPSLTPRRLPGARR